MGGISGVYLHNKEVFDTLIQSSFHLQHRGTESSAIDTSRSLNSKKIRPGEVKKVFSEKDAGDFRGDCGVGALSGGTAELVELSSSMVDFSLVYDGKLVNSEKLRVEMKDSGESFSTVFEAELLGRLISKGEDIIDGIRKMNGKVEGSYTLGILNDECLYVTRDPYGIMPLVVGENEEGYAFASESPALTELGFTDFRDVRPGEILKVSEDGVENCGEMDSDRFAHCAFEWMYTARPDSIIEGVESTEVRRRAGMYLARDDYINVDKVGPVPQSGIGYALGYHQESALPYEDFFYLNRFSKRSYIPSDPEIREQVAKEKLSVIKSSTKGGEIVICEDSIVRGNQLLRLRNTLKEKGEAKEVHARVGCPPLCSPCPYTQTTKKYSDLIYNQCDGDIGKVSEKLNLDLLKYNSVENLVEAINLPSEDLCIGCFTDDYPI
ncbi:hypothetical protein AKJ39_01990 [candidate division MSBL1 archaeon SCGC-AAA259J03]|uniref:Amidophosphoribosyltransferase n=1 Tax=candidate division MSBL1 archaeon SCGC-AAA259J03 TaxID=1698269 RepID=A0A656YWD6_9EURY|nr:hypothetical protein AKJ39_01990 [candidate division MSBL1 archaeon SCGC-AAA259J03]